MALVGMSMTVINELEGLLTCIGVLPIPLVLVRFPDMLQVDAYVHEERVSKESAIVESDDSILVQCRLPTRSN